MVQETLTLVPVPIDKILPSSLNRDTTMDEIELAQMIASFGDGPRPRLAEPPTGVQLADGSVRLVAGARRVKALQAAGRWQTVDMILSENMSMAEQLELRLIENQHRKDPTPFEKAAALKLGYYIANAIAVGAAFDVEQVLREAEEKRLKLVEALKEVEYVLTALPDWYPTRPALTWKIYLDSIGMDMEPTARRNLLKLLDVQIGLQDRLTALDLSEVALRGIAMLGEADQEQLVEALERDPERLSSQVAAITDKIRKDNWTVEQALTHFLNVPTSAIPNNDVQLLSVPDFGSGSSVGGNSRSSGGGSSAGGSRGDGGGGRGRGERNYDEDGDDGGYGGGGGSGGGFSSDLDGAEGFELEGIQVELPPGLADRLEALAEDGTLTLSDNARKSLAQLPPADQQKVLERLLEEPKLVGKLPSIVKIMRDEGWRLEAAIEEVLNGKAGNGKEKPKQPVKPGKNGVSVSERLEPLSDLPDLDSEMVTPEEKLEAGTEMLAQISERIEQTIELFQSIVPGGRLADLPQEYQQPIATWLSSIFQMVTEFNGGGLEVSEQVQEEEDGELDVLDDEDSELEY